MVKKDSRKNLHKMAKDSLSRSRLAHQFWIAGLAFAVLASTVSCRRDRLHVIEISVPEQKMALYRKGVRIREYPVSTSKFGLGDEVGSNRTPLGHFEIEKKLGTGRPSGAVLKDRKWTGEILAPNAPGRDPIVSRILWLRGLEPQNRNAYGRYIYIHGTTEEQTIGQPVSYGCIRMRSRDVMDLDDLVGRGAGVYIVNLPLRDPAEWVGRTR
jgi:hypothetical protein